MKKIAILCFDGFQMLDVTGPADVLTHEWIPSGSSYHLTLISVDGGQVKSSSGLTLLTQPLFSLKGFNSLVIVGGHGVQPALQNQTLIKYIQAQAQKVKRVIGICTGGFLLAKAGLLANREATSHWRVAKDLVKIDPSIRVQEDSIYIKSGHIYTSAGITAGIDLTLSIVTEDFSSEVAMSIARDLVMYYHRPGGQKQFSHKLEAQTVENQPFESVRLYIDNNIDRDLTVERLAEVASMSGRNFSRQFTKQVNMTPAKFVESARVNHCQHLLQNSEHDLTKIAKLSGFSSVDIMRRSFQRKYGITPSKYRRHFQFKNIV